MDSMNIALFHTIGESIPYYWKRDPILLERAHLHDPIVLDRLSHTMENIESDSIG